MDADVDVGGGLLKAVVWVGSCVCLGVGVDKVGKSRKIDLVEGGGGGGVSGDYHCSFRVDRGGEGGCRVEDAYFG